MSKQASIGDKVRVSHMGKLYPGVITNISKVIINRAIHTIVAVKINNYLSPIIINTTLFPKNII